VRPVSVVNRVPTSIYQRIVPLDHIEGRREEFKVQIHCRICNYEDIHHFQRAIRSQQVTDEIDAYVSQFTADHAGCGLVTDDYDPPAFGPALEKWNYVQTWGGFTTYDPYTERIQEAEANLRQATYELDSFAQQEWANILNRLREEQQYYRVKLEQVRSGNFQLAPYEEMITWDRAMRREHSHVPTSKATRVNRLGIRILDRLEASRSSVEPEPTPVDTRFTTDWGDDGKVETVGRRVPLKP
jgi:hypothetical protein